MRITGFSFVSGIGKLHPIFPKISNLVALKEIQNPKNFTLSYDKIAQQRITKNMAHGCATRKTKQMVDMELDIVDVPRK